MAQISPEAISGTTGRFYDAAYGAATWTEALAGVATLFGGSRSWLFHTRSHGVEGHTSIDDPDFHTSEARQAILRDPFFLACRQLPLGKVVLHSEIHDLSNLRRRELWQDWLRPRDLFFGMQCLVRVNADDQFLLDVSRDEKRGDFTEEHRAILSRLVPHLARAGDISTIVSGKSDGGALPGSRPVATVVIDRSLRVIDANPQAHRLFEDHSDIIGLSASRLSVASPSAARRLHELAMSCLAAEGSTQSAVGGLAMIGSAEDEGTARIIASAAPHTLFRPFAFDEERFAALFLRPVHGSGGEELDEALISLFNLNPSHARLARALANGISLRQAAAERGLSYASARTYLEHIFRQTGTSRQPQLVALLKAVESALPG